MKDIEKASIKAYCGKCISYKNFGYMKGECQNTNNYKDTWFGEKSVVNEIVKILNKNNDCAWYEEK